MTEEAKLEPREHGRAPTGPGWFVVNAADAAWVDGPFGAYTAFEGPEARFVELGVNIAVLTPGQANCYYHAEDNQEDFLVLDGEALLLVDDQERPLRRWDFVHCPPGTAHVFVATGERPCVLLGTGARAGSHVVYPVSETARRHGAGVERETDDPAAAYAACEPDLPAPAPPGWPPGA